MSLPYTQNQILLNAVTATVSAPTTTASTGVADVSNRQKMSLQFTASSITSGNGVFTVYVSNDGTNWVLYNRLTDNLANTNAQTDTRVASATLSTNTSKMYFFPVGDHFRYIGVAVARTTDGTYSATLQAAG